MNNGKEEISRKVSVSLELKDFKIPPCGDMLVVGRKSPIGLNAGKKMLDFAAPEQFDCIVIEDAVVEGLLIRKDLFFKVERALLIEFVLKEVACLMSPESMLTVKCDISVRVTREIQMGGGTD